MCLGCITCWKTKSKSSWTTSWLCSCKDALQMQNFLARATGSNLLPQNGARDGRPAHHIAMSSMACGRLSHIVWREARQVRLWMATYLHYRAFDKVCSASGANRQVRLYRPRHCSVTPHLSGQVSALIGTPCLSATPVSTQHIVIPLLHCIGWGRHPS